jgi:hypothetical protein
MGSKIGTGVAVVGLLIAAFGFLDALGTSPDIPELDTQIRR